MSNAVVQDLRMMMRMRGKIDNAHARKDQHRRHSLRPGHRIEAHRKADAHRYHRLHVGIHTDQHRLEPLLPHGYQEIGHERRPYTT